jgi:hypothetical protein
MPVRDLIEALGQMPGFLSLFTPDGSIAWLSRTDYGVDHDSLIGQPSTTLILEDDRGQWAEWIHRVARNREQVRYSVRCRVPGPPEAIIRLTGRLSPVVLGGAVRYVCCMTFDTTYQQHESCEGCKLVPTPSLRGESPEAGRAWLWLSPLERRILDALAGRGWTTSKALARLVAESNSGDLRAILRNLTERLILDSSPGKGYRVKTERPPPPTSKA